MLYVYVESSDCYKLNTTVYKQQQIRHRLAVTVWCSNYTSMDVKQIVINVRIVSAKKYGRILNSCHVQNSTMVKTCSHQQYHLSEIVYKGVSIHCANEVKNQTVLRLDDSGFHLGQVRHYIPAFRFNLLSLLL